MSSILQRSGEARKNVFFLTIWMLQLELLRTDHHTTITLHYESTPQATNHARSSPLLPSIHVGDFTANVVLAKPCLFIDSFVFNATSAKSFLLASKKFHTRRH